MRNALLLAIPVAVWLAGCSEAVREPEASPQPARIAVKAAPAAVRQWPSAYEATGTVTARISSVISAKWLGYVRDVRVKAGDPVMQSQVLIMLDARDLDAGANRANAAREEMRGAIPEADSAIAGARSNLDLAQVTFKRMSELYAKKSISDQELDESSAKQKAAQAAYDMARAKRAQLDSKLAQADEEVRAAQVTRSYAEIQAPFAGTIAAKSVEAGNLAVPGVPLLTLEGNSYRLEVSVDESRLPAIRPGQAVSVSLDARDHGVEARVSEILPAVDAASRSATVRIDLPALPNLRSGIFGRAIFPFGSHSIIAIPASSLVERGQLQSVYVAENGVAHLRLITLGDRFKDQAEVLSGLAAGEMVITPAPQGLSDGARIEVRP